MRSSLNPVVSYRILNPLQGGTSIRPYGPGTSRDCSAVTHQPSSQAEPGSSAPDRVSHRFTTFAKPLSPTRRLQRLPLLFFPPTIPGATKLCHIYGILGLVQTYFVFVNQLTREFSYNLITILTSSLPLPYVSSYSHPNSYE